MLNVIMPYIHADYMYLNTPPHTLKRQSHEIFVPGFFYLSTPSGPIRDGLGPYGFFLLFQRVIGL